MLRFLSITNFATIEHVELDLAAGFNVLTGETGAGKSIIVDALGLLLGSRADAGLVRSGSSQARVEGIFLLEGAAARRVQRTLAECQIEDNDGELLLAREVSRDGRNVCRVNGRVVPLKLLSALGEGLVDLHGQHQHLSLFRVREHREILDRYGDLGQLRGQVAVQVQRLLETRQELDRLAQQEQELARQQDFLQYQLQEISDADPRPGEEEELEWQHARATNAEKIIDLVDHSYQLLYLGEDSGSSVLDILGRVGHALSQLERLDPSVAPDREAADAVTCQVAELARALRGYREGIDHEPERLHELEERLRLLRSLKRKYGATLDEVLAFAERAREELEGLSRGEERRDELQALERELQEGVGRLAGELSQARRGAAQHLAAAVEREVSELAMEHTQVRVSVAQTEAESGVAVPVDGPTADPSDSRRYAFDVTGIDQVEFLISPNPGEPLQPLARIASGGEASRLMLGLKVILSVADQVPTLVFDEVDSGVGGRMGSVLGQKLWRLSEGHQVLCVTHLPQIACYADHHLKVAKRSTPDHTLTSVEPLSDEARQSEISAMLGSASSIARRNAGEMLEQARMWKLAQGNAASNLAAD